MLNANKPMSFAASTETGRGVAGAGGLKIQVIPFVDSDVLRRQKSKERRDMRRGRRAMMKEALGSDSPSIIRTRGQKRREALQALGYTTEHYVSKHDYLVALDWHNAVGAVSEFYEAHGRAPLSDSTDPTEADAAHALWRLNEAKRTSYLSDKFLDWVDTVLPWNATAVAAGAPADALDRLEYKGQKGACHRFGQNLGFAARAAMNVTLMGVFAWGLWLHFDNPTGHKWLEQAGMQMRQMVR
jgi:hypothetical protein